MARLATVLIAEDEDDVRDLAVGFVTSLGYSVLSAANGEEALAILKSATPVDLLLTDIVMPGRIDGLALGRHAVALRPALKILHVTGYSQHLFQDGPRENGGVISKPYNREQLRVRLARLLGSWAVDRNPTLNRLHQYWLGKRGERPWPDRSLIDPSEIVDILPNLAIVESLEEDRQTRFRFRLVGTKIVAAYGFEPTGRYVEEITTGEYRDLTLRLLREVVREGRGIYSASAFRMDAAGLSAERLFLPLAAGAGEIRQIIVGQTFDWSDTRTVALTIAEQSAERTDTVERLG
jgi:CheY-like chemotaxis protein